MAESVTLAQVVRLRALAAGLDESRYDVHFASSEFEPLAFGATRFKRWPISTIDKRLALRSVERGERVYDCDVLSRYVDEELGLFRQIRPDLVIGDFRLSLSVSARLARIPLAALINAYWSPHLVRESFPVPDHPIVNLIGAERAARYLPQALPIAFRRFVAPINAVRERHGLPAVGGLLEALTDADHVLYPDIAELYPMRGLPPSHRFIGAVQWSPEVPLPASLAEAGRRGPLVYATLGSSGRVAVLPALLEAVRGLPMTLVLATAGRSALGDLPDNVVAAEFFPGHLVARAARFVVSNGGSSTGYQALAEGRPVLGIPSNMDQYLAMTAIERAGAGMLVRSGAASPRALRSALTRMLEEDEFQTRALALGAAFARWDCERAFAQFLDDVLRGAAPQVQERDTSHG